MRSVQDRAETFGLTFSHHTKSESRFFGPPSVAVPAGAIISGESILFFPFPFQRADKIRGVARFQELVVLNHGGDADAQRRHWRLNPDDSRAEPHAHRLRKGNVRGKSQRDLQFRAGR